MNKGFLFTQLLNDWQNVPPIKYAIKNHENPSSILINRDKQGLYKNDKDLLFIDKTIYYWSMAGMTAAQQGLSEQVKNIQACFWRRKTRNTFHLTQHCQELSDNEGIPLRLGMGEISLAIALDLADIFHEEIKHLELYQLSSFVYNYVMEYTKLLEIEFPREFDLLNAGSALVYFELANIFMIYDQIDLIFECLLESEHHTTITLYGHKSVSSYAIEMLTESIISSKNTKKAHNKWKGHKKETENLKKKYLKIMREGKFHSIAKATDHIFSNNNDEEKGHRWIHDRLSEAIKEE